MDGRLQVRLEEDRGGSARQMDRERWAVICAPVEVTRHMANKSSYMSKKQKTLNEASLSSLCSVWR